MHWTNTERAIAEGLLLRLAVHEKSQTKRLTTMHALMKRLNADERTLVHKVLALDPKQYGFRGKNYGLHETNRSMLEMVPKSTSVESGHFLPKPALRDFKQMNVQMSKDLGTQLTVLSGYRSPAYQLILFLSILRGNKFHIQKTCRRVAFPGWSEHGSIKTPAVDLDVKKTKKGEQSPSFGRTKEYRWLKKHAYKYHFYLSYPRNNTLGVQFEPWHWHWEK